MTPEMFILAYRHIPSVHMDDSFLFRINPYDFGRLKVDSYFYNNDFNSLLQELSDYILTHQQDNVKHIPILKHP